MKTNEMKNLHKFYYKDYFADIEWDNFWKESFKSGKNQECIRSKNRVLCGEEYKSFKNPIPCPLDEKSINSFSLKVAYPGLVTGIGIDHEVKITNEFKLGVHFDWTYGVPVVYGSSVKGVLKRAFRDGYVDSDMINKANKRIERIDTPINKIPDWVGCPCNHEALIDDIFNGKETRSGKYKSIYDRDIFFDAVIEKSDCKGRILCPDAITPHGTDPLKNPTPITFLKIAPGCKMVFRYRLQNTIIKGHENEPLTIVAKRELFREILTTVGVGAKTNVGYGQLKEVSD